MAVRNKNFFVDYYKTNFKIFRLVGGWIITKDTKHKKIWTTYLSVVIALSLSVNLVQLFHLFELSSIRKLAQSGYVIATACMASYKSFYIFKNRKLLLKLIDSLQEPVFLPKDKHEEALAKKPIMLHRKVQYTLILICSISVLGSMITPIFSYQERRLIFQSWYPFELKSPLIYVVIYAQQFLGDCFISYMNIYVDMIASGFTTFVGIQCDILCYNLKELKETELEDGFKNCFNHHILIWR